MGILLFFAFLVVAAVDIWGVGIFFKQHRLSGLLRLSFFGITVLAFAVAFWVASFFSYYHNSNTHVFGWPVPRVVFQRDTPTSPWLDYVGPTVYLAYPMNFAVYMFIPSIAFIIFAKRWRTKKLETEIPKQEPK